MVENGGTNSVGLDAAGFHVPAQLALREGVMGNRLTETLALLSGQ